jgi:hypothetical protein
VANQSTLQVLIDIKSQLNGLTEAVTQMRQLKAETEATAAAGAGGFANLFKLGESIDLVRRLNDVVSELPHKLIEWIGEGIRFNAEIEKSRIGIAAMLRQFDPGQFQTFGSALQASGPVLDLLREKSIQLGISFPALAEQYQSTVGAMFAGGVRDIQKQIDLTTLLRQATQSLPFAQNVIQRDIVDILQAAPRAAVTDVGRTLGIDQQSLDRAKEAGQIVPYLTSKLSGFTEASQLAGQTLTSAENRAKTLQQVLAGTFTTELVVAYKNALDDVNAALAKPQTAEDVAALGSFVGAIAHGWLAIGEGIVHATEDLDKYLESLALVKTIQDNPLANAIDEARANQFFDTESKRLLLIRDQIAAANTLKEQDAARVKLNAEVAALFERANVTEGAMHQAAFLLIQDSAILVNNFDRIAGSAEKTRGAMVQTAQEIERITKANTVLGKEEDKTAILAAQNRGDDEGAFLRQKNEATVNLFKELVKAGVDEKAALEAANARGAELTKHFQDQNFSKKESLELEKQSIEVLRLRAAGETSQADELERTIKIQEEFNKLQKDGLTTLAKNIDDLKGAQAGLIEAGNIDLLHRPKVLNADGSISTVRSISTEIDGKQVLIPTVAADGSRILTNEEALRQYLSSGKHLGIFDSVEAADSFAQKLHNQQAALLSGGKAEDGDAEAWRLATQKVDAEIQIKNAKEGTKSAQQALLALEREETLTLQGIRQQQQLINSAPFLTIEEKNARLLVLMRQEITTLNDEVKRGQHLLDGGTLDKATYEQLAQKVQQARFEIELLTQKTQTLNFSGGLRENLTQWVNSFGTAAQQVGQAITGSINTALDATANALTDIIFQTGNWRQTVLNAEKAIIGSLIKIGLQMVVQKLLGSFLTKQNAQEQTQAGAQIAAAHAPAAAATSISSWGSAAVIGGIAAAAAIALIIGLLAGGFEKGGYTGVAGSKTIAGVVHGNEFVQPEPSVRYYGLDVHEAMRQRRIPAAQIQALLGNYRYPVTPRLGSFEVGGAVASLSEASNNNGGPSAAGGGPVTIKGFKTIVLNDVAKLRKEIFDSDEAIVFVIDAIKGDAHLVKGAIAAS